MTAMTGIGLYWRTLRHLRPGQFVGRARFRLARPRPELGTAPPLRAPASDWVQPAAREASLLGPDRLSLLNVQHSLADHGWDDPLIDRLWRYNLHYFDDLNAGGASRRTAWQRALVDRWIRENPPAAGTGWEPYPVSLRIVNWVKWFIGGVEPDARWLHSLAIQARWLGRRLEWHLLGNHLFANGKALVFAGLFFDGREAQGWLQRGMSIIERELVEQVLADGAHFERSTMYHALALEDLLDLLNIVDARAPPQSAWRRRLPHWRGIAARMLAWLRAMSHPDGGIAHFNDAAAGVAPGNDELERYAARLGVEADAPKAQGLTHFDASGHVRVAAGAAVALLDVAPVGPDYLPGHAHADTLSFELSIGARRVIVNGGTSCYGLGAQRLRERGTAWHSTVQLGAHDSSEAWSGFRVGRRARVLAVQVGDRTVEAAHDGYRHLPGAPLHRRRWQCDAAGLSVDDQVTPPAHDAVARFHLAPGLSLEGAAPNVWRVVDGNTEIARVEVRYGIGRVDDSQYAPRFGMLLPTQCLSVKLTAGRACTRWTWNDDAHPLPQ